jgi:hypothetical protein
VSDTSLITSSNLLHSRFFEPSDVSVQPAAAERQAIGEEGGHHFGMSDDGCREDGELEEAPLNVI